MALIICLVNTTNLAPVSDYNYEVMVGDGTKTGSRTIAFGNIKGHVREDGWQKLVKKLLAQETK